MTACDDGQGLGSDQPPDTMCDRGIEFPTRFRLVVV